MSSFGALRGYLPVGLVHYGAFIQTVRFLMSHSHPLTRLGGVGLLSLTPCAWCPVRRIRLDVSTERARITRCFPDSTYRRPSKHREYSTRASQQVNIGKAERELALTMHFNTFRGRKNDRV
ncbi:hypothetical protein QQF64_000928 [Cirrhinus molitorella]|uniref:Uncharacterized protein n=1 Tax=Cirrhinus molitorella TaxID=172907 RepID=A0ABR3NZ30_9TELE